MKRPFLLWIYSSVIHSNLSSMTTAKHLNAPFLRWPSSAHCPPIIIMYCSVTAWNRSLLLVILWKSKLFHKVCAKWKCHSAFYSVFSFDNSLFTCFVAYCVLTESPQKDFTATGSSCDPVGLVSKSKHEGTNRHLVLSPLSSTNVFKEEC